MDQGSPRWLHVPLQQARVYGFKEAWEEMRDDKVYGKAKRIADCVHVHGEDMNRLKAAATWFNGHHDVEGLCKEMPSRMHDLVQVTKGARLNK